YRVDKRLPGVGDSQLHMNPDDARRLGIDNGDYVWVDANPADRPFVGWTESHEFSYVARLMARVTYNLAYSNGVTMLKHAFYMATPLTVRAQQERPDGRALSPNGYQASFRHGSQQSITRGWAPPMHQTDTLFHKKAAAMGFTFGFDVDNHAINTCPKETLVKITKAESGGLEGRGAWKPGTTGETPAAENAAMQRYLMGDLTTVRGAAP
ncbi:MAG: nitrate oxidoreductase subunit alpha, partial [Acidimicrobiia bacterium]|nr:nitrate oxidoreductase subunit alpha [Acidimicrobiia bacterium]